MKPLFRILPALAALFCLNACESSQEIAGVQWPANTQRPVTADDIRALLAKTEPVAAKYRVRIELVKKGTGSQGVSNIELRPGQSGRIGQGREFSYPTEFTYPILAKGADAPVTPLTPGAFETKTIGWQCEATATPKGGIIELKGWFAETTFDGFISSPGEVASPIMGADGRILTDNKALQPRFTRRDSPIMVFAVPGKTYRLDVNSSSKRAWLNISCEPVTALASSTAPRTARVSGSASGTKPLLSSFP